MNEEEYTEEIIKYVKYRNELVKHIVDLMAGVPDFEYLAEHDNDNKGKLFIQYLAEGISKEIMPKSIAKSALSQYIKMKKAMDIKN